MSLYEKSHTTNKMYGNSSKQNWKISKSWTGSIFVKSLLGVFCVFKSLEKFYDKQINYWNSMNMELNGNWKVTNREKREHVILEHIKVTKFEKLH